MLRTQRMRRQRPRGATTREAVIGAALSIVDDVGVDALTVRAVAKRVGAPVMTLYTHFDTKEALLDLMYAEIASRLYADGGHTTWQTEIRALGRQIRKILVEHPRWAPLLSRPKTALDIPVRDRVLALMTTDGMTRDDAVAGLTAGLHIALGLSLVELSIPGADPERDLELAVGMFVKGLEADAR
jgi:TetR/AcrR family transcriptional regulator, tetracycline repressor protein